MKNTILKIKGSFRKSYKEEITEGEVSLENGKTYILLFDVDKSHIVVKTIDKDNQNELNIEETKLGFFKEVWQGILRLIAPLFNANVAYSLCKIALAIVVVIPPWYVSSTVLLNEMFV